MASGVRSARIRSMKLATVFLLLAGLVGSAGAQGVNPAFDEKQWAADVAAQRRAKDDEFRSRDWSALAVVALAAFEKPRIVVGSGEDADLRLDGPSVAARHAEFIKAAGKDGKPVVRIRELKGRVEIPGGKPAGVRDIGLRANDRVRIDRFLLYWDNFSTFGPVVRVLDYDSEAYTRFEGLQYFAPDPSYRVVAHVRPFERPERVMIGDTHGWQRPAWKYGAAAFNLHGRDLKLVLLLFKERPGPDERFFVGFSDETSGRETYGAGRYLVPAFVAAGPMVLDFNLASNPLCAYNGGFACPLPPKENRMPVPVHAGEKIYPHASGRH